jgi:uncharacterized membrane protein YhaH (DUF805 family)
MKFADAIKTVFKKYAVFEGVATRAEFWFFWLFSVIVLGGLAIIAGIFFGLGSGLVWSDAYELAFGLMSLSGFIWTIFYLAYLGLIIPHIALLVRRFRDTGRPFWYYFLILVPIAGLITILVMCMQPSKGAASHPAEATPQA